MTRDCECKQELNKTKTNNIKKDKKEESIYILIFIQNQNLFLVIYREKCIHTKKNAISLIFLENIILQLESYKEIWINIKNDNEDLI